MKWYGLTTYSQTVRDRLREYLKGNSVYYELSSCYTGWHFEIRCTEETKGEIEDFLALMD